MYVNKKKNKKKKFNLLTDTRNSKAIGQIYMKILVCLQRIKISTYICI